MLSYRTDSSGKLIDFNGSEIGLCVWVLFYKIWGKVIVNKSPKSSWWWENKLKSLINLPTIQLSNDWEPGIYNSDGTPSSIPIRYEDEFLLTKS